MKKVASGVYIEDSYPGVTIGAVVLEKGIVLIDAPLRPDDGYAWQNSLRELGNSPNRLLVNLDSHQMLLPVLPLPVLQD